MYEQFLFPLQSQTERATKKANQTIMSALINILRVLCNKRYFAVFLLLIQTNELMKIIDLISPFLGPKV